MARVTTRAPCIFAGIYYMPVLPVVGPTFAQNSPFLPQLRPKQLLAPSRHPLKTI